MKKSEAIRQIEALGIPYVEDGQSIEATQRSLRDQHFASYIRSRDMITVQTTQQNLDILKAQGWNIMMRAASFRDFDPEEA